jgi:hypothetical protein
MNNMEVMEFTDKIVRDGAYNDLRQNGDELERQVVRFSGCEQTGETRIYRRPGQFDGPYKLRSVYRSTWSLAYPRS